MTSLGHHGLKFEWRDRYLWQNSYELCMCVCVCVRACVCVMWSHCFSGPLKFVGRLPAGNGWLKSLWAPKREVRVLCAGKRMGLKLTFSMKYQHKKGCECLNSIFSPAPHASILLQWRHNERHCVSKLPASRLFTQPFIQAQIKENIKAPRHWPLCGEFTGIGEFPAQMASNSLKMFPFDGVFMFQGFLCA